MAIPQARSRATTAMTIRVGSMSGAPFCGRSAVLEPRREIFQTRSERFERGRAIVACGFGRTLPGFVELVRQQQRGIKQSACLRLVVEPFEVGQLAVDGRAEHRDVAFLALAARDRVVPPGDG